MDACEIRDVGPRAHARRIRDSQPQAQPRAATAGQLITREAGYLKRRAPGAAPGCLTWNRDFQPTKLTSKDINVGRRVNVPSPAAAPSQEGIFYHETRAQARVVQGELAANWVVLEADSAIEGIYPLSKHVAIRRIKCRTTQTTRNPFHAVLALCTIPVTAFSFVVHVVIKDGRRRARTILPLDPSPEPHHAAISAPQDAHGGTMCRRDELLAWRTARALVLFYVAQPCSHFGFSLRIRTRKVTTAIADDAEATPNGNLFLAEVGTSTTRTCCLTRHGLRSEEGLLVGADSRARRSLEVPGQNWRWIGQGQCDRPSTR
eukprot:2127089-Prymnesium_polylepis.1